MVKPSVKKQNESINAERQKLMDIFTDILPEDQMAVAEKLIDRIAFMSETLKNLENDIKSKGATYKFQNGKQEMIIENPSQKSYSTLVNRYTAACKELFNLLSKEQQSKVEDDGFDSFLDKK
ncbi:hypothetical protein GCM10028778_11840 [Barrientosiimonas marina]|uniref:P27 family phage terminase small subunit n=1 Tax=Lentibacillus kimchii TaxID=1542911 RepID=A0ABW2UWT0_9BACI